MVLLVRVCFCLNNKIMSVRTLVWMQLYRKTVLLLLSFTSFSNKLRLCLHLKCDNCTAAVVPLYHFSADTCYRNRRGSPIAVIHPQRWKLDQGKNSSVDLVVPTTEVKSA